MTFILYLKRVNEFLSFFFPRVFFNFCCNWVWEICTSRCETSVCFSTFGLGRPCCSYERISNDICLPNVRPYDALKVKVSLLKFMFTSRNTPFEFLLITRTIYVSCSYILSIATVRLFKKEVINNLHFSVNPSHKPIFIFSLIYWYTTAVSSYWYREVMLDVSYCFSTKSWRNL